MASARPIKLPPRRTGLAAVVRRQSLPTLGLAAVALALAVLIGHDVFFPSNANLAAALSTFTVGTGTVTNSVSSSGTLMPAQQMNLGFKTAGSLTEVDVRSGDHVSAGQVLAKIDTAQLQIALQTAQAQLASAQATLSNTLSGTSLQQSLDSLNQARQSYNDAITQANTTNSNDQSTLNADQATLNSDQVALNNDVLALQNSILYQTDLKQLTIDQNKLQTDTNTFNSDGCAAKPLPYVSPCDTDYSAVRTDQNNINSQKLQITNDQNAAAPNYLSDQARVPADQARVNTDSSKLSTDQSAGSRSIQQAQNSVTNAQDSYNNQSVNRPATIQQEQAQVASSSAQVDTAQLNLDASTLTAPAAGVISSVTAQVGDSVAATNSGSGAEAPGSTALLPSSGSGTAASGGSAFMTLLSDKSYVAVVSFAESDAAKILAGQTGTVTFDAVSGLSVPAHVLAVAASATVSSNVVNYYVTLALDSTDSRLKPGLTSNATVITARAANVLVVPNRAITKLGNLATVLVVEAGKQVATQVTLGIAGASTTEVLTGLTAGQKVVLPTAKTTGTTTTTGAGGGRGFGGGGGGGGGLITGGG